jgi:hypothetical protein
MPTITEAFVRRLPVAAVMAALAGWLGLTALTTLAVQPETVVALGNPAALAAADGGALVAVGRASLVLRPAAPGAVRRLYAGGAWLVLPAPGAGCLPAR